MRAIKQAEADAMRDALKRIASFGNPAIDQSQPSQGATRVARTTLEELSLFYEKDANDASRE